jgi:hypothetical protein
MVFSRGANRYRQPLEDRDGTYEYGLPSDIDSE